MRHEWTVTTIQDAATGLYGARWATAAIGANGEPAVHGNVGSRFELGSDARGHAAMWIARYEDAEQTAATPPVEVGEPWLPTDADLTEAFDAHRSQFAGGDVTLGA